MVIICNTLWSAGMASWESTILLFTVSVTAFNGCLPPSAFWQTAHPLAKWCSWPHLKHNTVCLCCPVDCSDKWNWELWLDCVGLFLHSHLFELMANFNRDSSASNCFVIDNTGSDLLETAATCCLSVVCCFVVNYWGAECLNKEATGTVPMFAVNVSC